jgi:PilZ domain
MHIVLPVNFDNALGQTENISASGIYATFSYGAAQHVQPGSSVRLEMLFEHATPDGPLRVACEGEVVRVDRRGDELGVAARITSYGFGNAGVVDRIRGPSRDSSACEPRGDASSDGRDP